MSWLARALSSLYYFARTVVPAHCVVCHRLEPRGICPDCFENHLHFVVRGCRGCGKPLISGALPEVAGCGNCGGRGIRGVAGTRSLFVYTQGARELLHGAKFGGRTRLLSEVLELAWQRYDGQVNPAGLIGVDPLEVSCLIPVPLSPARFFIRGVNQAEVLAHCLSRLSGVPHIPDLVHKVRNTPSQSGLSRRQRELNVKGAFRVNRRQAEKVRGKSVLLVDDLITTGATVGEMAKVLRRAGVEQVFAFSLFTTDPRFG